MLQSAETRRLKEQYNEDPVRVAALLIRCTAGLALLIGIALIGVHSEGDPGARAAAVTAHAQPAAVPCN